MGSLLVYSGRGKFESVVVVYCVGDEVGMGRGNYRRLEHCCEWWLTVLVTRDQ